jgi:hypothetical protein
LLAMKNQYFCVIYVECIFLMRERYDLHCTKVYQILCYNWFNGGCKMTNNKRKWLINIRWFFFTNVFYYTSGLTVIHVLLTPTSCYWRILYHLFYLSVLIIINKNMMVTEIYLYFYLIRLLFVILQPPLNQL